MSNMIHLNTHTYFNRTPLSHVFINTLKNHHTPGTPLTHPLGLEYMSLIFFFSLTEQAMK